MSDWLEELVCPLCRGRLERGEGSLLCSDCGHRFELRDGVPIFTGQDAAEQYASGPVGRAAAAVVAIPRVYDAVQRLVGARRILRQIEPMLHDVAGSVVDVGAGTGNLAEALPAQARYLWLDSDPHKLKGFRKRSAGPALVADATKLPFPDDSIDWAASAFVLHHLEDAHLDLMLGELHRVVRRGVFVLDAVADPSLRSRVLWRYDRGRHPRPPDAIRDAISARFAIVAEDEFAVVHRYVALTATSRRHPQGPQKPLTGRASPPLSMWESRFSTAGTASRRSGTARARPAADM